MDAIVLPGGGTTFSIALANTFPVVINWRQNGGSLTGATFSGGNTDTLTITDATNGAEGGYNVFVIRTDAGCFATSDSAMLIVCK